MAYIIFYIIVTFFALVGFIECIRWMIFRIYKSKSDNTVMLITPVKGHSEDVEYTLRSCAAKVRWMGKMRPWKVVCLDEGMDESTKQVCEYICSEYEFMEITDSSGLAEMLNSCNN